MRPWPHGRQDPTASGSPRQAGKRVATGDVEDRVAALEPRPRQAAAGSEVPAPGPLGPYFADFACLEARLEVEVDGEHHSDQPVYDARRDKWLGEMGLRVLRFWVSEVDENLEGVIAAIAEALVVYDLDGPPTTLPPPGGGRTQASPQCLTPPRPEARRTPGRAPGADSGR